MQEPFEPRRVVVVEHEPGCPLDRFADWLGTQPVEVVRPHEGEPVPSSVDGALIVLGGRMSAYDDEVAPWLPDVRRLLAASVAGQVPTLGICLGAQLLAVAAGGVVDVGAPAGREAGVIDVRWRPEATDDPLVAGLPDPVAGPSMHADAVVELPPTAVWLASGEMYPYQAFRVGQAAWGVQFHPEVSPATFAAWAATHSEVDSAAVTSEFVRRDDEIIDGGRGLAERFAKIAVAHSA